MSLFEKFFRKPLLSFLKNRAIIQTRFENLVIQTDIFLKLNCVNTYNKKKKLKIFSRYALFCMENIIYQKLDPLLTSKLSWENFHFHIKLKFLKKNQIVPLIFEKILSCRKKKFGKFGNIFPMSSWCLRKKLDTNFRLLKTKDISENKNLEEIMVKNIQNNFYRKLIIYNLIKIFELIFQKAWKKKNHFLNPPIGLSNGYFRNNEKKQAIFRFFLNELTQYFQIRNLKIENYFTLCCTINWIIENMRKKVGFLACYSSPKKKILVNIFNELFLLPKLDFLYFLGEKKEKIFNFIKGPHFSDVFAINPFFEQFDNLYFSVLILGKFLSNINYLSKTTGFISLTKISYENQFVETVFPKITPEIIILVASRNLRFVKTVLGAQKKNFMEDNILLRAKEQNKKSQFINHRNFSIHVKKENLPGSIRSNAFDQVKWVGKFWYFGSKNSFTIFVNRIINTRIVFFNSKKKQKKASKKKLVESYENVSPKANLFKKLINLRLFRLKNLHYVNSLNVNSETNNDCKKAYFCGHLSRKNRKTTSKNISRKNFLLKYFLNSIFSQYMVKKTNNYGIFFNSPSLNNMATKSNGCEKRLRKGLLSLQKKYFSFFDRNKTEIIRVNFIFIKRMYFHVDLEKKNICFCLDYLTLAYDRGYNFFYKDTIFQNRENNSVENIDIFKGKTKKEKNTINFPNEGESFFAFIKKFERFINFYSFLSPRNVYKLDNEIILVSLPSKNKFKVFFFSKFIIILENDKKILEIPIQLISFLYFERDYRNNKTFDFTIIYFAKNHGKEVYSGSWLKMENINCSDQKLLRKFCSQNEILCFSGSLNVIWTSLIKITNLNIFSNNNYFPLQKKETLEVDKNWLKSEKIRKQSKSSKIGIEQSLQKSFFEVKKSSKGIKWAKLEPLKKNFLIN